MNCVKHEVMTHQRCSSRLLQVTDNFDRQEFNKMCWLLCSRKNLDQNQLFISSDDAFKIWCIFNFLSEDRYPLTIVTEEVSVDEGVLSYFCDIHIDFYLLIQHH